jgi:tetratricopeptide (TPR) repeat protein
LFLVLVAVASGLVYVVLRQQGGTTGGWQDPVAAILPDEIAPDLALYPLAGASEWETIDAAIFNGDLETAYATLVFGPDLSDAQRLGRLIMLGRSFAEAGESERSDLITLRQAYDAAVLSPGLNDPTRADALLASGKGWAALEHRAQALEAYNQVYMLAVRSPYLHMAHRRDLLSVLEVAYRDLDDAERAQACLQRIIEFDQEPSRQPPARPVESAELAMGAEQVSSAEVGALEEGRRQAALALIEALPEGEEPPHHLVSGLGQALQAEDMAKLSLYKQELEATTQPGRRIGLHWQVIDWLMLKYRVATMGFGLSLVPDWETQAADIQSSLSKAYEDLFFDYEDLVTGLPQASLMAPGSYEVRRRVIQAGRLGQYPNYPEQQLTDKLRNAVADESPSGESP